MWKSSVDDLVRIRRCVAGAHDIAVGLQRKFGQQVNAMLLEHEVGQIAHGGDAKAISSRQQQDAILQERQGNRQ